MDLISIAALLVLAHAQRRNSFFNCGMKKHFVIAAYITVLVIAADMGCLMFDNGAVTYRNLSLISNTVGFALSPIPGVALAGAFSVKHLRSTWPMTIPVILNLFMALSSPWTGMIFSVSSANEYARGPLFSIYVIAYVCSLVLLVLESLYTSRYYQWRSTSTLLMLFVFIISGTSLQVAMPDVHTSLLCVTLSLVVFYSYFCELVETQDHITGLLNRNAYDNDLKKMERGGSGTVIIFDLDDFKSVNDRYGHLCGDECLGIIGAAVKECFSPFGFCYRIGGDELCVLSRTQDEKAVRASISAFHHRLHEIRSHREDLPMVSVGYSFFHGKSDGINAAVQEADDLMYYYKANRKQDDIPQFSDNIRLERLMRE